MSSIQRDSQGACSVSPWSRMANPWGVPVSAPVACSLEDVMSEQLAAEIDTAEQKQIGEALLAEENFLEELKYSDAEANANAVHPDSVLALEVAIKEIGEDVDDELIARCLQREYDKEYDAMVDKVEQKYNGTNKVSISFENYKMKHQRQETLEQQDDDDDYDEEYPEFPSRTVWEAPKPNFGGKGYVCQGKNIVTKHDKIICGRQNAERLMQFPPGFESGDGEGMDMQLPNQVFNKLKRHSEMQNKKLHKVHEKKEHSTAIKAVDEKTRILMFKLVNSGYLTSIDGVVSTGKEAVIFKANGGMKNEVELPKHVIIKVFKTTMNEFKNRAQYVYGDHRLSKDIYKKQNPRKIVKLWAEKEFMNLKRMRRQNIPCPTPLTLKKHILAMTCIGEEHPAPKLKEIKLSTEDAQDAYEQTLQIIKAMYHDCGLVHADLSEYNLLWHDRKVWIIDVSQSVEKENAKSHEFLLRDCQNICDFFKHAGVYGVSTAEELFMNVTNFSLEGSGSVFASQVMRYHKTDYAFDYYFEQSEASRGQGLDNDNSSDSEGEQDEEEHHIPEPSSQD